MKTMKIKHAGAKIFAMLVLIFLFVDSPHHVFPSQEIYIICHKDVPVDTLNKSDIKNIFLGKKTSWDNQKKITIVLLKTDDVYKEFLKVYIKRSAQQYRLYWRNMVFTGEGFIPKSFKSEENIIQFVSKTDGAIGFLPFKTDNSEIKYISVLN